MRIMYVAFRYHTNQIPIMHGWAQEGVQVKFLAQGQGEGEEHDDVIFHQMKPSHFTKVINQWVEKKYDPSRAESVKSNGFIPSFFDVVKEMFEYKPDVVVIRELSRGNAVVVAACRVLGIKNIVMYVQTPLYGHHRTLSRFQRIFRKLAFPNVTFTPVFYKDKIPEDRTLSTQYGDPGWFVPLVCDRLTVGEKAYCADGLVHVLDVGKYRAYKNHYFLVDAIASMEHPEKLRVDIIGQLVNSSEIKYHQELCAYIKEKGLEKIITARGNVSFKEMEEVYRNHDVLVLASKNETAGMVVLEAMAQGMCVLSSQHCGLASYLEEYQCGMTFPIDDPTRLTQQLEALVENQQQVGELGVKALQTVKENFMFSNYKEKLSVLLKEAYQYTVE